MMMMMSNYDRQLFYPPPSTTLDCMGSIEIPRLWDVSELVQYQQQQQSIPLSAFLQDSYIVQGLRFLHQVGE